MSISTSECCGKLVPSSLLSHREDLTLRRRGFEARAVACEASQTSCSIFGDAVARFCTSSCICEPESTSHENEVRDSSADSPIVESVGRVDAIVLDMVVGTRVRKKRDGTHLFMVHFLQPLTFPAGAPHYNVVGRLGYNRSGRYSRVWHKLEVVSGVRLLWRE